MLAGGALATMIVAPLVMLGDASGVANRTQATVPGPAPSTSQASPEISRPVKVLTLRQIQLTDARVVEHRLARARAQAAAAKRAAAERAAQVAAAQAAAASAQAASEHQAQTPKKRVAPRAVVHHVAVKKNVGSSGANRRSGLATYYYWHSGQCASPWLPHGTVVTIRDQATGATATCVVTDTQGNIAGHIIDLDPSVFTKLAPLSKGIVEVTISW